MRSIAVLMGSITCFMLMTMALFLSVYLLYIPEAEHLRSGKCTVTGCDESETVCYRSYCTGSTKTSTCYNEYYTCFDSEIYFELDLNNTEYQGKITQQSNYGRCYEYPYGRNITCFYDDRKISSTLSLTKTDPEAGGIAAVVVFSVFAFGFLVASIVAGFYIIA
jgi:hypothetical protein